MKRSRARSPLAHLLWLLLVLVLVGAALPAAAHPAEPEALPWRDKSSPFGMVANLGNRIRSDEYAQAIDLLRESGAQWQREEILWDRVQREPDGPFTWDGDGSGLYDYDQAIAAQVAAGINVLGLLDYNPYWFKSKNPPPEAWIDDWYAYVYATVRRYGHQRGWITHWELWNEPNVRESGYESGLYEIEHFVRLLAVGRAAALAADPNAVIVMSGMSGLTEASKEFSYDALDYLERVGELGGWDHVDILALHPYHPAPPESPIQRFDRLVTLQEELHHLDDLLHRYGPKPVWITELGWTTSQGHPGVSEEQQALFLVRAYLLLLAHPSVEKVFWYDFRNDTDPDAPYTEPVYNAREYEFHYGLLRRFYPLDARQHDLRKPAFAAYRTMTSLLGGRPLQRVVLAGSASPPERAEVYWYQFGPNDNRVDVLWRTGEAAPHLTTVCNCREALVRGWDGTVLAVLEASGGTLNLRPTAAGLPLYIQYDPPAAPQHDGDYFEQTGHTLRGAFRDYWYAAGGVARLGYPLTDELSEAEPGSYRPQTVQYFERARFVLAPDTGQVSLDGLGRLALQREPTPPPPADTPLPPDCTESPQTGYAVCPPFRQVWEQAAATGGALGAAISPPFERINAANGLPYTVQYFEHGRLEHFIEYQGTPDEVQFGLLGRELLVSPGGMP